MSKLLRELLLAVGGVGMAYEVLIQGGSRPEVLTALISLLATAGAIKVDEDRAARKSRIPRRRKQRGPDG
jgi:hypothetical protein